MTRTLETAVKNELSSNNIRPVHLISLNFSTPVHITDNSFELTSSVSGTSRTYSASSFILGFSEFVEQTDLSKSSLIISLSGANQTFISLCLSENVTNINVDIYRAFLNSSNSIINNPFLLYNGKIESFSIEEKETSSVVNLSVVSHWADFEKKNGRKTNPTSQKRFFINDLGMDFASQNVLNIKWGRS